MSRTTDKDEILAVLEARGEPLCDDCLVEPADLSARQRAYQVCSGLADAGKVQRDKARCGECGKRKNVTWANGEPGPSPDQAPEPAKADADETDGDPWYWEGNVQARLVAWLTNQGYQIRSVANTAERETGKDIIAESPEGERTWIEVKGYPESSQHTQARHWFSGAIFSLILDRDENPDVQLAMAFPAGFTTYENLAERVSWLQDATPFTLYWVHEDGSVRTHR